MQNFQTLACVFRQLAALADSTAHHLDTIATRELALANKSASREALLAQAIAMQRHALATELLAYSEAAPKTLPDTWLQYTPDTNPAALLDGLANRVTLQDSLTLLNDVDHALLEALDIVQRQDHPPSTKEACSRAAQMIQRYLERQSSAIETARDL